MAHSQLRSSIDCAAHRRIELPPASVPYRNGLIRGKEISVYYDQQRPVFWQEHAHAQAQVMVLFEPASFLLQWASKNGACEQELTGRLICGLAQEVPHSGQWKHEAGLLRVYLEPSFLRRFTQKRIAATLTGRPLPGANREPVIWQLASTLCFLCAESSPDPHMVEAISGAFVERLFQCRESDGIAGRGQVLSPERMKQVDSYIEASMEKTFQVADLARLVALSPPHFAEVFHRSCGRAPMHYVREYRLLKAHQMAMSGRYRAGEIATACGFYDVSHLNREFKKFFKYPTACLLKRTPPA